MAGTKNEVVIKIRLDDKGVPEEIRRLIQELAKITPPSGKGGAKAVGDQLGNIGLKSGDAHLGMLKLTGAMGGAMLAAQFAGEALRGVVDVVKDVGGEVARVAADLVMTADRFEVIGIRMERLRGGAGAAKEAMDYIKRFAETTPYNVEEISNAAVTLEAFGLKFEDNIRAVGDAAAMMGVPIEHSAELFGRFSQGMFNTRFLAQLGLSQKKLREWGLSFDAAGGAIGDADENYQKFLKGIEKERGGLMAQMMTTVEGKMSNLKDVVDLLKASLGDELAPVAKFLLDQLQAVVLEVMEAGSLREAISSLADAFMENSDVIADIIGLLPEVAEGLAVIITALAQTVDYIFEVARSFEDFGGTGVGALDAITVAFKVLAFGVIYVIKLFEQFAEMIAGMGRGDPISWAKALLAVNTGGISMMIGGSVEAATEALNAMEAAEETIASKRKRRQEEEGRAAERRALAKKIVGMSDAELAAEMKARGISGTVEEARRWATETAGPGERIKWAGGGAPASGGGGKEAKELTADDRNRLKMNMTEEEWDQFKKALAGAEKALAEMRQKEFQARMDEANAAYEKAAKMADDAIKAAEERIRNLANATASTVTNGLRAAFKGDLGGWAMGWFEDVAFAGVQKGLEKAFMAKGFQSVLRGIPVVGNILSFFGFQEGGIIKGGRGGVAGLIGEGKHSELVTPATEGGISTLVRGLQKGLDLGKQAVNVTIQGMDPWFVRTYLNGQQGAAAWAASTW